MVSSKPAEEQDNGVCALPPMQYNYIVGTKLYYQYLALACSSSVGAVCIDDTFSAALHVCYMALWVSHVMATRQWCMLLAQYRCEEAPSDPCRTVLGCSVFPRSHLLSRWVKA